jgi:glycosyltransferase involved in cell wall biosynthesis
MAFKGDSTVKVPKTRKILISGGLAVGGPQTHVTILCEILKSKGADVTIAAAATNWDALSLNTLRSKGVRIIVPPFGFGRLSFLGKAVSIWGWPLLMSRSFDIVYCIGEGRMHLVAKRYCVSGGHCIYHEIVDCPVRESLSHRVAASMTAIIGNSNEVTRKLKTLLPEIPIKTIPFLTSREANDTEVINVRKSPTRDLNVAFLGRLVEHKRPAQLIDFWIEQQNCSVLGLSKLHFYGGDCGTGYQDVLVQKVKQSGLVDRITLHGEYIHSQLSQILENVDLVVLPSLFEGLPLVLVEAMARGIPVVATSAGGTSELGLDNEDVIVTEGTDWSAFEVGLLRMISMIRSEKIDCKRLRKWTEDRYGFSNVSKQWESALLNTSTSFGSGQNFAEGQSYST